MPDRETYCRWVEAVLEVFEKAGVQVDAAEIDTGTLQLDTGEVLLDEIMWRCAEQENPKRWPKLIRRGLSSVGALPRTERKKKPRHRTDPSVSASSHTLRVGDRVIDLQRGPLSDVAELLRIQLFTPHSRGAFGALNKSAIVHRAVVPELWATLVFDLGGTEQTVPRQDSRQWGASQGKIWQTALDNLHTEPVELQVLDDRIYLLLGNGAFVSSLALVLDAFVHRTLDLRPPAHSSVVALPNWHSLLFQRFDAPPSEGDLTEITELTQKLFTLEDPVSPHLYQTADGELACLPHRRAEPT